MPVDDMPMPGDDPRRETGRVLDEVVNADGTPLEAAAGEAAAEAADSAAEASAGETEAARARESEATRESEDGEPEAGGPTAPPNVAPSLSQTATQFYLKDHWANNEVVETTNVRKMHKYDSTSDFAEYKDVDEIKLAVTMVINKNIDNPNIKLVVDNPGNIQQHNGDLTTMILSKTAFDHIKEDIKGGKYDDCGKECSNVLAYIQYYVALACKCASIDTTSKGQTCHKDADQTADDDFDVNKVISLEDLTTENAYRSKINGTECIVKITNGVMTLNPENGLNETDNVTGFDPYISIVLTDYRTDRIRHICLICIYYFVVFTLTYKAVLPDQLKVINTDKQGVNQNNLRRIIECWRDKNFEVPNVPAPAVEETSAGGRPRGRKASPRSAGASEWFNTGRKDSRTGKTVWQNLKTGRRVTKSYVTSAATGKRTVRHMSVAR
jgi:hypothetical protein